MPELPEVTTTVEGLNQKVAGLKIVGLWRGVTSDLPMFKKSIKNDEYFEHFKGHILGDTIKEAHRHGKYIEITLSKGRSLTIHLKMTGHLMYGKYVYSDKNDSWHPDPLERQSLHDKFNRYIRFVFILENGHHLVFCDSRKFGHVSLTEDTKYKSNLGVDPVSPDFTIHIFNKLLEKKPAWSIKQFMLDQRFISGIGNIYADEISFNSLLLPTRQINTLDKNDKLALHKSIIETLKAGISLGGDSMSDYRNIDGEKGSFQLSHNVYRRLNKPCQRKGCAGVITKTTISGRSSYYCPICQK